MDGVYGATVREIKTIGFYLWRLFIAMWSINQPTTQINAHISRDSTGGTFTPESRPPSDDDGDGQGHTEQGTEMRFWESKVIQFRGSLGERDEFRKLVKFLFHDIIKR